jgi:hypothetical protein
VHCDVAGSAVEADPPAMRAKFWAIISRPGHSYEWQSRSEAVARPLPVRAA